MILFYMAGLKNLMLVKNRSLSARVQKSCQLRCGEIGSCPEESAAASSQGTTWGTHRWLKN